MKVGVRLLLVGGNHIAFNTTDQEASSLIQRWRNKELPEMISGFDYTPSGMRWEWVARTVEIAAMHTFEVPPEPKPSYPGINRSGLN